MQNPIIRFILRYKILHIIFWVWVTIALNHEYQFFAGGTFWHQLPYAINTQVFCALGVYTTIYYLIPRFINRREYLWFILATLLVIVLSSMLSVATARLYTNLVYHKSKAYFDMIQLITKSFDATIKTVIFIAVVFIQNRVQADQKQKSLERERLKAELELLKAQINPHFLFNSINNIYVLIQEDKKLAAETLLNFSELLRYQLYECNNEKMPIYKELHFLNNFVKMEKLRTGNNIEIDARLEEPIDYMEIAPFLLMPFVENAFKHISHFSNRPNKISIRMSYVQGVFEFVVQNTYDPNENKSYKGGGVGLANVKRRLDLLYPGNYSLAIKGQDQVHTVNLKLHVH